MRRAPNLARVAFGENFVARQMNGVHGRVMPLREKNVLGNVHQHRAGTAARCDVESFVNDLLQLVQFLHHEIVFGAGAGDAERVGLLKRIAADELGGHLPGDGHDGNRIHHRVHQTRHQVGRARTGRRAAHAHFAGGARIAFGREARILFVAHQDMADGVIVNRVIQRQRDAAGIAEEAIHALLGQTFQQHFRAAH